MRVNAAWRHQPEQVAGATAFAQALDQPGCRQRRREAPVFHRLVDARQILHHHPTRTEIEVSDLRIAHLAGRQAHIEPGRLQEGMRTARP